MKFLSNLDLSKNQLLNAKLQVLAGDPGSLTAGDAALVWFDSTAKAFKGWDGSAVQLLTNTVETITGTGPVSVNTANKSASISVANATSGAAGLMSSTDYTKLAGSTALNTGSALVQRDPSGNFSAGTITANLTGTASNASALENNNGAYYLSRAYHTGSQTASTISDLATVVQGYRLDQFAQPGASVNLGAQRITNLADPTSAQDGATKNYVDSVASGLDVKNSVRAASTANLTLTYNATSGASGRGQITGAPKTLDGINLTAGDRILLKDQTAGAQNGIWTVTTVGTGANGVWDRATDFDRDAEVTSGAFTFVEEGTQAATGWVLTTLNPITVGGSTGTALTFAQFNASASYTAGNGLTLTGSAFSAVGTANRISVSGSGVDIASTYVGQTSITTLGTIATGTWNASTIGLTKGGTGATTATAARTNLGATGKFAGDIGDGTATSYTVTHNLGSLDVHVAIYEKTSGAEVFADITHATVNTVTIAFASAPGASALRAVVVG